MKAIALIGGFVWACVSVFIIVSAPLEDPGWQRFWAYQVITGTVVVMTVGLIHMCNLGERWALRKANEHYQRANRKPEGGDGLGDAG